MVLDPIRAMTYLLSHKDILDSINYTFILNYTFVIFLDMKTPSLLDQEMCPCFIIPHQSCSTITLNRS